jgi:hypothetical protein
MASKIVRTALAVLLSIVAVLAVADVGRAVPCQAGEGHGDGKIRRGSGTYRGSGIYNCDGTDQSVGRVTGAGDKKTFDAKYKNDSTGIADITLLGDKTGEIADFKVKIIRPDKGNKNVTDKFFDGGVVYRDLAAGESTPRLRIVVKGLETVGIGDDVTVHVRGRLGADLLAFFDQVEAVAGLPV